MISQAETLKYSREHMAFLKKKRLRRSFVRLTQFSLLIMLFALWEIAAVLRIIDPFIFSQPTRMMATAYTMAADGSLFFHMWVTLKETVIGFLLGTVMGTLLAILFWWNDFIRDVTEPYLVVLNALPKTALAPILIVWIGANKVSIVVTAVLTSIVVTIMTVLAGFLSCDSDKLKLIKTFSGTKKQMLTKVLLPYSIPTIISALKINVGLSFVGVIVGEFLVAKEGLGYMIVYGSQIFICVYILIFFFATIWYIYNNFIIEIKIYF